MSSVVKLDIRGLFLVFIVFFDYLTLYKVLTLLSFFRECLHKIFYTRRYYRIIVEI